MSRRDYIEKIDNAERRFFSIKPDSIQLREEGESRQIEGIAAVVNSTTSLGWFDERIAPGAFDDVLKDDVVAVFNHDANYPLARNGKGLELFVNKNGDLGYRFEAPNTSIGNDLLENIRSGLISKSSFAFKIKEEEWRYADKERENDLRTIIKLERLYDVSPVTYPAYSDTSVAARSLEKYNQEKIELRKFRRRMFNVKYNR